MVKTLHFRNAQIGDQVVTEVPDHQLQTAPVVQTGVFQNYAALNADSRNVLYAFEFTCSSKKSTPEMAVQGIGDAQLLVGLRGTLLLKVDGVTKIQCTNWMLVEVPKPALLPAWGGRFCEGFLVRFAGETPPSFP